MTCALLTLFGFFLDMGMHPFHVSVSEIFYNEKNESFEITMKVFTDDLENALRAYSKYDIYLDDNLDEKGISKWIREYLQLNFSLEVNGQKVEPLFLGAEAEMDAVWCYLEVRDIRNIKSIHVHNSVLMELFPDQVNLVHVDYAGKIKSLQLNISEYEGTLSTEQW